MIKVFIVDDHDLMREGIRALLEKNPDILAELGTQKGARMLIGFAAETERLLDRLRERIEGLVLRTALIAGFPSKRCSTRTISTCASVTAKWSGVIFSRVLGVTSAPRVISSSAMASIFGVMTASDRWVSRSSRR